jgi:hypothetical protein
MTVVNGAAIRQDIKQWSGLVLTGAWVSMTSKQPGRLFLPRPCPTWSEVRGFD